ncbi:MAG TPA: hypothetical protein PKI76_02870 [Oscillospiraceae bacterium]|nr:hypothetical protein [Oscillospiraceae bacterium]HNW04310.1 hypothetical protein [Oscillospiraceae bacterium]
MSEQVIFSKSTFGGFNKEEVLKYIDRLNAEHTASQEQADAEIQKLGSQLKEKEDGLSENEKAFRELSAAYEELREHYMSLKEHCGNLEAQLDDLKRKNGDTEKELTIAKELNRQLEDKIEACQAESREHDEQRQRWLDGFGSVELSARSMLTSAKNGAQNMIADAQGSVESVNADLEHFREELGKTRQFLQDSTAVLGQRLDYIDKAAERAKIPAAKQAAKYDEVERHCEEIGQEVSARIADMKAKIADPAGARSAEPR